MSREIDRSGGLESLSTEDLEYLRDRGRLTPDEERQYLGGIKTDAPTEPNLNSVPNTGDVNANAPGKGSNGEGEDDGEPVTAPYSEYTKDVLQREIERRNSGRPEEDHIVPEGTNKQDLIDALDEDDEE